MVARKEQEKDKQEPSQGLINDIGTALRFVDEDFGSRTQDLTSLIQNAEITYELLWALFPPKEETLFPRHGVLAQDQAGYLSETHYKERADKSKFFEVTLKIINHDGEDFGWAYFTVEIDEFEGTRKITSLAAHPLRYHPEKEAVRKQLVTRGRKYVQVIKEPICQEYVASMAVKLDRKSSEGRNMLAPVKHIKIAVRLLFPILTDAYVYFRLEVESWWTPRLLNSIAICMS